MCACVRAFVLAVARARARVSRYVGSTIAAGRPIHAIRDDNPEVEIEIIEFHDFLMEIQARAREQPTADNADRRAAWRDCATASADSDGKTMFQYVRG